MGRQRQGASTKTAADAVDYDSADCGYPTDSGASGTARRWVGLANSAIARIDQLRFCPLPLR